MGPGAGSTSTSGGPANRSLMSDVDLACQDDVSTRMRQSPRSRTLVVGHVDRRERSPHIVGVQPGAGVSPGPAPPDAERAQGVKSVGGPA
jgi:hypothetical protein